jgi:hypothetical protein
MHEEKQYKYTEHTKYKTKHTKENKHEMNNKDIKRVIRTQ